MSYNNLLDLSNEIDFTDILPYGVIYQSGYYKNMPIIVYFPFFCPNNVDITKKIYLYIINLMDSITNQLYILIYIRKHKNYDKNEYIFLFNRLLFNYIKELINIVPDKYINNLSKMYVLGFGFHFKALMKWKYPKILSKTFYCKSTADLMEFNLLDLDIPQWVDEDKTEIDWEEESKKRRRSRYLIDLECYVFFFIDL